MCVFMCMQCTTIIDQYCFLKRHRLYNSSSSWEFATVLETRELPVQSAHTVAFLCLQKRFDILFSILLCEFPVCLHYNFSYLCAYSLIWFLRTLYILIIESFALWIANVPFQAAVHLRIFLHTIFKCGWKKKNNDTPIIPR